MRATNSKLSEGVRAAALVLMDSKGHEFHWKKAGVLFDIKAMTPAAINTAFSWADEEGWNPGTRDGDAYLSASPDDCLALFVNGQHAGSATIFRYDDEGRDAFAFFGLFIIAKMVRHKGLGKLLWLHAMRLTSGFTTIGLFAVPQEQERYERHGFSHKLFSTKRLIGHTPGSRENVSHFLLKGTEPVSMLDKLLSYDRHHYPADRSRLITALLAQPDVQAYVYLNNLGKCSGYVLLRPCTSGYRITLYANNLAVAKVLCRVAYAALPQGGNVFFDAASNNKYIEVFKHYFGLKEDASASTLLMLKSKKADISVIASSYENSYGVLSLECG